MFMHGSWSHILGNMLFLWIFGNNVEDTLGRLRFLVWYLVAGLAATATQTFVTLQFGDAAAASVPNIGASGAVSGVLGAYLLLYPTASVLTLFGWLPIQVPAFLYLGFWFFFQLWSGSYSVHAPGSRRRSGLLRARRRLRVRGPHGSPRGSASSGTARVVTT